MAKKLSSRLRNVLTPEMQIEMKRIESLWKEMEAVNFGSPLSDEARLNNRKLHSIWNIEFSKKISAHQHWLCIF